MLIVEEEKREFRSILNEEKFKPRYHCPLPRKKQRVAGRKEKNGKVKKFTEEEIFLYQMKKLGKRINTL